MYIERCEVFGEIKKRGMFSEYSNMNISQTNTETLLSMFIHTQEAVDYRLNHKTLEGYTGSVMFNYLWIDIDSKEINHSIGFAHTFVDNLCEKYSLKKDDIVIYFSGRKGFHIGLNSSLFGRRFFLSDKLPSITKMLVAFLCGISPDDSESMKASPVDFGIYYHVGLLRAPLSRHPISNCYKIRIPYELVEYEDVDSIIENAKECLTFEAESSIPDKNPQLAMLFDECIKLIDSDQQSTQIFLSGKPDDSIFKRQSKTVFFIPKTGERANALYKMAFRLFKQPDLVVDEVKDIMRIVFEATNLQAQYDGNNTDLLKIGQLRTLLDSAYRRARSKGNSEIKIVTFDTMARAALQYILTKKDIPTSIPKVDALHGGLVIGNFYPIIGQRGTKKSILIEDVAINAALNYDVATFMVNAEMSDVQFFRRGVSMAMKQNFYNDVLSGKINNSNIEDFISHIGNLFSKRLLVSSEPGISVEQIDSSIVQLESQLNQKISHIAIDSFAAIAGESDELKKSMHISKYLKDMSKTRGVATTIICHVNQACDPHIRDTSKYTRGGGKMADNADGYFCTSLCVDIESSNIQTRDFKYIKDTLFLRYVDKRESGDVVDTIIKLDDNLSLVPTNEDPKFYEVGGI